MKRYLYLLLLLIPALGVAQSEVLLHATFDGNGSEWTARDSEYGYAKVENGKYVLRNLGEKSSSLFWHSGVDIDPAYDFEISTEIVLTEGKGEAFGIIWGALDAGNFYSFNVSSGNRFRVFKYGDRKFGQIKDWTATKGNLKTGGQINRLGIRKEGAELVFLLNGTEQFRTPFQSFFGNRAGYILYGKNSFTGDNFQIIQDKNLPVLFEVSFDENPESWFSSTAEFQKARFADGKYLVTGNMPDGKVIDLNEVEIDTEQDFEITLHGMQIEGPENKGYGMIWGGQDNLNFYSFMVTNMGAYRLSEWENGEAYHLLDWTPSDQILGVEGETTKLTVKKVGEYFTFYLNEKLLYKADFADFYGNQLGFIVEDTLMVAFDDIFVRQGMKIETFAPPGITWFTPVSSRSTLYSNTANIEAGLNSTSDLGTISLYVNGDLKRQVKATSLPSENGYSAIFKTEVELKAGENDVTLVVKNENGSLTEESRNILVNVIQEEEKKEGTDYALLIATDEYEYWSDLTNPVNDARTIARELEEHYGYEVEIMENTSKKDILKKLKEYAKRTYQPMDQLLIFFAGHGKFDPFFGEGYVVATNSLKEDEGNDSYISHSSLRTIVNNIPCEHTFLVMDVCFGGTIDPFIASGGHRGGTEEYKELTSTEFVKRKMRFKTRKYLTSGGKEYVPDGTPGQHSPFARKFLEALRNYGGHDKILTLSEMLIYFERVIPEPRFGEFGANQPGSDFLFITR